MDFVGELFQKVRSTATTATTTTTEEEEREKIVLGQLHNSNYAAHKVKSSTLTYTNNNYNGGLYYAEGVPQKEGLMPTAMSLFPTKKRTITAMVDTSFPTTLLHLLTRYMYSPLDDETTHNNNNNWKEDVFDPFNSFHTLKHTFSCEENLIQREKKLFLWFSQTHLNGPTPIQKADFFQCVTHLLQSSPSSSSSSSFYPHCQRNSDPNSNNNNNNNNTSRQAHSPSSYSQEQFNNESLVFLFLYYPDEAKTMINMADGLLSYLSILLHTPPPLIHKDKKRKERHYSSGGNFNNKNNTNNKNNDDNNAHVDTCPCGCYKKGKGVYQMWYVFHQHYYEYRNRNEEKESERRNRKSSTALCQLPLIALQILSNYIFLLSQRKYEEHLERSSRGRRSAAPSREGGGGVPLPPEHPHPQHPSFSYPKVFYTAFRHYCTKMQKDFLLAAVLMLAWKLVDIDGSSCAFFSAPLSSASSSSSSSLLSERTNRSVSSQLNAFEAFRALYVDHKKNYSLLALMETEVFQTLGGHLNVCPLFAKMSIETLNVWYEQKQQQPNTNTTDNDGPVDSFPTVLNTLVWNCVYLLLFPSQLKEGSELLSLNAPRKEKNTEEKEDEGKTHHTFPSIAGVTLSDEFYLSLTEYYFSLCCNPFLSFALFLLSSTHTSENFFSELFFPAGPTPRLSFPWTTTPTGMHPPQSQNGHRHRTIHPSPHTKEAERVEYNFFLLLEETLKMVQKWIAIHNECTVHIEGGEK